MFEIDQFIADCRASLTERGGAALQEVVARTVADPAALSLPWESPRARGWICCFTTRT